MKLIDKENDLAIGLCSFAEYGLDAAPEFVAGSGAFGQGSRTRGGCPRHGHAPARVCLAAPTASGLSHTSREPGRPKWPGCVRRAGWPTGSVGLTGPKCAG